ncbi:hypothetical protein [Halobacterium zhouii]|uniref:hypothetical protein n=1 Tax=Halobacterium zhouii TaxID=2902624 RepID=UPI001E602D68|nr:hypothetical protein [Halobacterium zhouii]
MTDPDVTFDGQTLYIDDSVVEMSDPIKETLVYDDLVIVCLEPPGQTDIRDNVVAYDFEGQQVWRIDPVTTEDYSTSLIYVGLSESDDGKLIAHNWNEASYEVDPETGAVELHWDPWSK